MTEMSPVERYVLGQSREVLELITCEQQRAIAQQMVEQTTRTLYITSQFLDPRIYNNPDFCAAVTRLATRSRYSQIRILIRSSDVVVGEGHCLVELARRLSSYINIRLIGPDFDSYKAAMLVVDETGYIQRQYADRFEGSACFHDPNTARELVKLFHDMWEHSVADQGLRRLNL